MRKKAFNLISLSIVLLFFNGCGFKPILVGSDYNFLIQIDSMTGDSQINSKIERKLEVLKGKERLFKFSPIDCP